MTHSFLTSDPARELLESRSTCPFMPVFAPPRVMITGGHGCRLTGSDGRSYLDFLAGIAVVSLGHGHPSVAEAIARQARSVSHVSNFFANPWAADAALKLDALVSGAVGGPSGGQVFFSNSGAEANELAIKLARKHGGSGRFTVLSAMGSFHGRTLATLAATGQPVKQAPFLPMPEGFEHVPYGDLGAIRRRLADGSAPAIAAVLLESIQGEGGVIVPDPEYLSGVRAACDEHGALLMVDEVQTGLGRTGRWFGFEHSGVSPDVVTLAKALGNGFPVGATWARREVAACLSPGDHGSTYSASALAGAVVSAVLDELGGIDAPGRAARMGDLLADLLGETPGVDSVRGCGLLLAAELSPGALDGRTASAVAAELLDKGLIVNAVTPSALRLAPPLVVSDAEIHEAVSIIGSVLSP
jgi:acetylornithine/succinyldiaminopimelate/putrescine aminotransferase